MQEIRNKWFEDNESELDDNSFNFVEEETAAGSQKLEDFADNLMRHIILGIEFMPFENFYASMGYNYLRRQELKINNKPGMVGFSWGFGFKISKFHFSYGRASYHLAGGSNHFSLSTNLSEFYKRSN
ncbi:MAG: hypothetical protein ACP5E3_17120 [Bacteroidales bacterium]